MTMEQQGGEGANIGGASFQIGIDLQQFERDFDNAEQIARQRATRIEQQIESVPIKTEPPAPAARQRSARQRQRVVVDREATVQGGEVPEPTEPPAVEQQQNVRVSRRLRTRTERPPSVQPLPDQGATQSVGLQREFDVKGEASAPDPVVPPVVRRRQRVEVQRSTVVTGDTAEPQQAFSGPLYHQTSFSRAASIAREGFRIPDVRPGETRDIARAIHFDIPRASYFKTSPESFSGGGFGAAQQQIEALPVRPLKVFDFGGPLSDLSTPGSTYGHGTSRMDALLTEQEKQRRGELSVAYRQALSGPENRHDYDAAAIAAAEAQQILTDALRRHGYDAFRYQEFEPRTRRQFSAMGLLDPSLARVTGSSGVIERAQQRLSALQPGSKPHQQISAALERVLSAQARDVAGEPHDPLKGQFGVDSELDALHQRIVASHAPELEAYYKSLGREGQAQLFGGKARRFSSLGPFRLETILQHLERSRSRDVGVEQQTTVASPDQPPVEPQLPAVTGSAAPAPQQQLEAQPQPPTYAPVRASGVMRTLAQAGFAPAEGTESGFRVRQVGGSPIVEHAGTAEEAELPRYAAALGRAGVAAEVGEHPTVAGVQVVRVLGRQVSATTETQQATREQPAAEPAVEPQQLPAQRRAARQTVERVISQPPTLPRLPRSGEVPRVHVEEPTTTEAGEATQQAYILASQGLFRATIPPAAGRLRADRRRAAEQAALGRYHAGDVERVRLSEYPPYARDVAAYERFRTGGVTPTPSAPRAPTPPGQTPAPLPPLEEVEPQALPAPAAPVAPAAREPVAERQQPSPPEPEQEAPAQPYRRVERFASEIAAREEEPGAAGYERAAQRSAQAVVARGEARERQRQLEQQQELARQAHREKPTDETKARLGELQSSLVQANAEYRLATDRANRLAEKLEAYEQVLGERGIEVPQAQTAPVQPSLPTTPAPEPPDLTRYQQVAERHEGAQQRALAARQALEHAAATHEEAPTAETQSALEAATDRFQQARTAHARQAQQLRLATEKLHARGVPVPGEATPVTQPSEPAPRQQPAPAPALTQPPTEEPAPVAPAPQPAPAVQRTISLPRTAFGYLADRLRAAEVQARGQRVQLPEGQARLQQAVTAAESNLPQRGNVPVTVDEPQLAALREQLAQQRADLERAGASPYAGGPDFRDTVRRRLEATRRAETVAQLTAAAPPSQPPPPPPTTAAPQQPEPEPQRAYEPVRGSRVAKALATAGLQQVSRQSSGQIAGVQRVTQPGFEVTQAGGAPIVQAVGFGRPDVQHERYVEALRTEGIHAAVEPHPNAPAVTAVRVYGRPIEAAPSPPATVAPTTAAQRQEPQQPPVVSPPAVEPQPPVTARPARRPRRRSEPARPPTEEQRAAAEPAGERPAASATVASGRAPERQQTAPEQPAVAEQQPAVERVAAAPERADLILTPKTDEQALRDETERATASVQQGVDRATQRAPARRRGVRRVTQQGVPAIDPNLLAGAAEPQQAAAAQEVSVAQQQGGGFALGGASFAIGIDLRQFERDLDEAERIARERAGRIQEVFSGIRIPVEPVAIQQPRVSGISPAVARLKGIVAGGLEDVPPVALPVEQPPIRRQVRRLAQQQPAQEAQPVTEPPDVLAALAGVTDVVRQRETDLAVAMQAKTAALALQRAEVVRTVTALESLATTLRRVAETEQQAGAQVGTQVARARTTRRQRNAPVAPVAEQQVTPQEPRPQLALPPGPPITEAPLPALPEPIAQPRAAGRAERVRRTIAGIGGFAPQTAGLISGIVQTAPERVRTASPVPILAPVAAPVSQQLAQPGPAPLSAAERLATFAALRGIPRQIPQLILPERQQPATFATAPGAAYVEAEQEALQTREQQETQTRQAREALIGPPPTSAQLILPARQQPAALVAAPEQVAAELGVAPARLATAGQALAVPQRQIPTSALVRERQADRERLAGQLTASLEQIEGAEGLTPPFVAPRVERQQTPSAPPRLTRQVVHQQSANDLYQQLVAGGVQPYEAQQHVRTAIGIGAGSVERQQLALPAAGQTAGAPPVPQQQAPPDRTQAVLNAVGVSQQIIDAYRAEGNAASELSRRERELTEALVQAGQSRPQARAAARAITTSEVAAGTLLAPRSAGAGALAGPAAPAAAGSPIAVATAIVSRLTAAGVAPRAAAARAATFAGVPLPAVTAAVRAAAAAGPTAGGRAAGVAVAGATRPTAGVAPGGTTGGAVGRRGPTGSVLGFNPNDIRLVAGLVGIPFGINILASIGRDIHQALANMVERQVAVAQEQRQLGISAGPAAAAQVRSQYAQFQQNPGTVGTLQEYLSVATGFQRVANQFSLTTDQVNRLTTASGVLARLYGTDLNTAGTALAQVLGGNVDAAERFNVQLTDEYGRLRSVGATFDQLVGIVGRNRAEQQLYADVIANVARQNAASGTSANAMATAFDQLRRSLDEVGSAMDSTLGPAAAQFVQGAGQRLHDFIPTLRDSFKDLGRSAQEVGNQISFVVDAAGGLLSKVQALLDAEEKLRHEAINARNESGLPQVSSPNQQTLQTALGAAGSRIRGVFPEPPIVQPQEQPVAPPTGQVAEPQQRPSQSPLPQTIPAPAFGPGGPPPAFQNPAQTPEQEMAPPPPTQPPPAPAEPQQQEQPIAPAPPTAAQPATADQQSRVRDALVQAGASREAADRISQQALATDDLTNRQQRLAEQLKQEGLSQEQANAAARNAIAATNEQTQTVVQLTQAEQERARNQQILSGQGPASIQAIQQQISEQQSIATASQGPQYPLRPLGETDAQRIAEARAAQTELERRAQERAAATAQNVRTDLQQRVDRPQITQGDAEASAAAQQRLDDYNRQVGAQRQLIAAEQQQARAQNAQAQAQAQADIIQTEQDARHLGAQQQLADLQLQQLAIQDQLAPALLEEAGLRDRITLATQQNLDLQERVLQAQLQQIPASAQLADLQLSQQESAEKIAVASIQRTRGQAPSYDIGAETQNIVQSVYAEFPAELQATQAQRRLNQAQAAQQQVAVGQQLNVLPEERRLQQIQQFTIPEEAAARLAQAQQDAISRAIQAADLQDTPRLVAAQTALLEAKFNDAIAVLSLAQTQAQAADMPPIAVNLTIPGNVQIDPALLTALTDAAAAGAVQAIVQSRGMVSSRVSTNVAGGR